MCAEVLCWVGWEWDGAVGGWGGWQDVAKELPVEMGGEPDLLIGNYSDGNTVASLLSHKLGVTQVGEWVTIGRVGGLLWCMTVSTGAY